MKIDGRTDNINGYTRIQIKEKTQMEMNETQIHSNIDTQTKMDRRIHRYRLGRSFRRTDRQIEG